MSLEFDRATKQRPILGTAAAVAMAGAVFTPWIDTDLYGAHALTFIANVSAAVNYSAVSWTLQESDDNGTTSNVIDAEKVVDPRPSTGTSKVFHVGVLSKKRYVRAAFTTGGAETGQIMALLDHIQSMPVYTAG